MKHSLQITLILLALFIVSNIVGLFIIKHYLPEQSEYPLGIEKPEINQETSFIPIFIMIIVATILALLLMKVQALKLWKVWYLFSIFVTLTVAFTAFIPSLFAAIIALIFALIKTFKPNIVIHNFTEIFVYGGLAALFVPVLNLFSIVILLILISIYDMIAVWKTKHMISLAKFQTEAKIFGGLMIPYKTKSTAKVVSKKTTKQEVTKAILGGGDIAFPLIFAGVVLKIFGVLPALTIVFSSTLALLILFLAAKKGKFYPAMPFLTAGCFFGYFLIALFF